MSHDSSREEKSLEEESSDQKQIYLIPPWFDVEDSQVIEWSPRILLLGADGTDCPSLVRVCHSLPWLRRGKPLKLPILCDFTSPPPHHPHFPPPFRNMFQRDRQQTWVSFSSSSSHAVNSHQGSKERKTESRFQGPSWMNGMRLLLKSSLNSLDDPSRDTSSGTRQFSPAASIIDRVSILLETWSLGLSLSLPRHRETESHEYGQTEQHGGFVRQGLNERKGQK